MRPLRPAVLFALCYSAVVGSATPFDDVGGPIAGCAHTAGDYKASRENCAKLEETPVPTKEEYALGGAVAIRIVGKNGLIIEDATLQSSDKNHLTRYLDIVGKNLGAQSARPTYPWTFSVVDDSADPAINAFSTPGGYVFVTKTLLKRIDNEAQLAGVLAHEIGHITERHAIHQYQRIKRDACDKAALAKGSADVAGAIAPDMLHNLMASLGAGFLNLDDLANADLLRDLTNNTADALTTKGYDPQEEFTADKIAAELMVTAGYNPYELMAYLRRLPDKTFSNHPPPKEREAALREWVKQFCDGGSLLAADCPFKDYPAVPLPPEIKKTIAGL